MKKTLFLILTFLTLLAMSQPVETLRVANSTTAFGSNLPVGTQVFDAQQSKLYVAIDAVLSSETLTTAADKFELIVNYNRLQDEYLSLYQGVVWNKTLNTYQRMGSIINVPTGQSAGNENLPVQSQMKRCVLTDEGTVAYYIDPANPHFKGGENTPKAVGTTTSTSAGQLVDGGASFVTAGVLPGMVVKNTSDGTFSVITAVAATSLTVLPDHFTSGEGYEVGTADYGGTDGQVMVEIPKFYYRVDYDSNARYWGISRYNLPGYQLHPAFWKDGQEVDYRYYSAFEGSMYDESAGAMIAKGSIASNMYASGDIMCSIAGQWPKTNETRGEYRDMAAERGEGWRQLDWTLNSAVQLLYLVEYADFHTQGMIGNGRTSLSNGSWAADSYIGITGLSIGDGNGTNSVSNGGTAGYLTDYMTYRGIENWFGNVWKMLDGITWDGTWTGVAAAQPVYYTNNVEHFKDYGSDNMRFLTNASYIVTLGGYISDFEETIGFIPASVGNSSLVYDYYWQYSESGRNYWRVVRFGAVAPGGGAAGGFALTANNAWSHADAAIAGRLAY